MVVFTKMETFVKIRRHAHLKEVHINYTITQLINTNAHLNRATAELPATVSNVCISASTKTPESQFNTTDHRLVLSQAPDDAR